MLKLGYLIAGLQAICGVALLATSAWLISRAAEMPPVMYLMIAVVGVRAFALGRAGFRYGERVVLHDAVFRQMAHVRPLIFKSLIPFAPAALGRFSRGGALTTVVNDVDELQNKHLRALVPLMQAALVALLAVAGIALVVPNAAFSLLAAALGAFFLAMPISAKVASRATLSTADQKAQLQGVTVSTIENYESLKAYGWLDDRLSEISRLTAQIAVSDSRSANSVGIGSSLMSLLSSSATISALWFASVSLHANAIGGVFLAVVALIPLAVFEVIQSSQGALTAWQKYRVSNRRIQSILQDEVPLELSPESGEEEINSFESLRIIDAGIKYPDAKYSVFTHLNIHLQAREKIALVGPSGSGKSTLAYAILGFAKLSEGAFEINGKRASSFDLNSVRKIIGYLEQNPSIFLGTVRQNLLLAKPDATDDELIDALRLVRLEHTFAARDGLETQLGERGLLISGGEAQRLALARAVLAKFEVLILDEPTANVDLETAELLMSDIFHLAQKQGQALILITHDSELAARCERIIELKLTAA